MRWNPQLRKTRADSNERQSASRSAAEPAQTIFGGGFRSEMEDGMSVSGETGSCEEGSYELQQQSRSAAEQM